LQPEGPVKLIDLVLDADGEEIPGFFLMRGAVEIMVTKPDRIRPYDLIGHPRHRDTALGVAAGLFRGRDDLRIDIDPDTFLATELYHRHALKNPDMRRGDADAGCRAHRIQQVCGKRAKLIAERCDGLAGCFQAGVREAQNGADGQENHS
jgi:hypothetical protein